MIKHLREQTLAVHPRVPGLQPNLANRFGSLYWLLIRVINALGEGRDEGR